MQYRSFSSFIQTYQKSLQNARKAISQMKNHSLHIPNRHTNESDFPNVRKSRRISEKKQRKDQEEIDPQQKTIQNVNHIKKVAQQNEFNRLLIERLKNPKNLSQTTAMYRDNKLFYSINVKHEERCSKHEQKLNQSETLCMKCIKPGIYWFSELQLRRINNGVYFRRFIESRLLSM